MSFRVRLTVLASLAVAVAIVGTSFAVYVTTRSEQMSQVDNELRQTLALPQFKIVRAFGGPQGPGPLPSSGNVKRVLIPIGTRQIILPRSLKAVQVKVRASSTGPTAVRFTTKTIGGVPSRVLSYVAKNRVVQASTSLVEVQRNLSRLRWLLVLISLGGIAVAAMLGALVSRTAVAPLRRLTETTEGILETGDLSRRTGQRGRDEISHLSGRLDELLAMLESSLRTQRQLVADASHELRTPIATLRANVELLAEPGKLDPRERADLVVDVKDELESMTMLVGELVELARGEERDVAPTAFRLDEVVRTAVERASRRAPELAFRTRLEPSVVTGVPERIERAVSNLLDNARKWSPARAAVDVSVHDGIVEVRDRGPGIAAEDVPLVFNRFYRSTSARGTPGAGLGLAIVKQIADAHGGSVSVDRARGGGAILRLRLSPSR